MSILPTRRTIQEVFNTNYAIDFYQREYRWTASQINALLSDLFFKFDADYKASIDPNENTISRYSWYYLSTIVTNAYQGEKYIVDGQQRLTSLTLILIKLHSLAMQSDLETHLTEWLRGLIYGSGPSGRKYRMGANGRGTAFDRLLTGSSKEIDDDEEPIKLTMRNIESNYSTISSSLDKLLSNEHRLRTFILYFTYRIQLVELEITDPTDVAMVFEVINDRGERLDPYEVLKGELLGQLDRTEIDTTYLDIWNKSVGVLQTVDSKEPDRFLQLLFRSRYARTDADFRDFENEYHRKVFSEKWNERLNLKRNPEGVKQFLVQDLKPYCSAYRRVLRQREKAGSYVYFNSVLNEIDRQFLLILAALLPNDPEMDEKIVLVARLVDRNYSLLQLMGAYNSNTFADSVIYLLPRVRDNTQEGIQQEFDARLLADIYRSKNIQLDDPFQWNLFKNAGYELGARFLRYFFARLEHYVSDHAGLASIHYYDLVRNSGEKYGYHIEHILAVNDENRAIFGYDEEKFFQQRNRLGGLVMLKGRDNSASSNEPYQNKLKTYQHGTLMAQSLIPDFHHKNTGLFDLIRKSGLEFRPIEEFTAEDVEERQLLYFEMAKRIWGDISFPKTARSGA